MYTLDENCVKILNLSTKQLLFITKYRRDIDQIEAK